MSIGVATLRLLTYLKHDEVYQGKLGSGNKIVQLLSC